LALPSSWWQNFQSRWRSFGNFTSLYPWTGWYTYPSTQVIRYVSALLQCTTSVICCMACSGLYHHTQLVLGIWKLKERSPSTALEFTFWYTAADYMNLYRFL
jgi:hypothetical protein